MDIATATIINGMYGAMVVLVLLQPLGARIVAAAIFVGITILHDLLWASTEALGAETFINDANVGIWYYGSAIAFDFLIMKLLDQMEHLTDMAVELHLVCLISIFANIVGWGIWFNFFPPDLYNWTFVVIYAYAIWILIKGSKLHVGGTALGRGHPSPPGRRGSRFTPTYKI